MPDIIPYLTGIPDGIYIIIPPDTQRIKHTTRSVVKADWGWGTEETPQQKQASSVLARCEAGMT